MRVNFRYSIYHATFDEFLSRDDDGRTHFDGQHPTKDRHRDRVWPALSRYKHQHRRRRPRYWNPHWAARQNRALRRACRLTVLRRWYPMHPLEARTSLICDLAQRPPRYTDFREPWSPP
jgi:hypothetical protein